MRFTRCIAGAVFGLGLAWNSGYAQRPADHLFMPHAYYESPTSFRTQSPATYVEVASGQAWPTDGGVVGSWQLAVGSEENSAYCLLPTAYSPEAGFPLMSCADICMPDDIGGANPQMIGDFLGYSFYILFADSAVLIPDVSRGSFKIAENESPRPADRCFLTYNYFGNVNGSVNPAAFPRQDIHRETLGFEKTFWDADASIGVRLPLLQTRGLDPIGFGVSDTDVGDLTIVTKFALIRDRFTGDVLSAGLALTVPSGEDAVVVSPIDSNPALIQPWMGFVWNVTDHCFFQGFTAVVIPTESDYVTLLSGDFGLGYWLYSSPEDPSFGIVPALEVHITSPLDASDVSFADGGPSVGIVAHDQVVITAGTHFLMGPSSLAVGLGAAAAGPRAFDIEAVVQWNCHF